MKKKSTPGTRVEEPATQVAESLKITEDLRRVEDSLEVINRQAKVEEDEKVGGWVEWQETNSCDVIADFR